MKGGTATPMKLETVLVLVWLAAEAVTRLLRHIPDVTIRIAPRH